MSKNLRLISISLVPIGLPLINYEIRDETLRAMMILHMTYSDLVGSYSRDSFSKIMQLVVKGIVGKLLVS